MWEPIDIAGGLAVHRSHLTQVWACTYWVQQNFLLCGRFGRLFFHPIFCVHLISDFFIMTTRRKNKTKHFSPNKPSQPPSLPLPYFHLLVSKCPYEGISLQTTLIIDSFHAEPRFFFHSWTPHGRNHVLTGPCFLSTQQVSNMDNLLPKHKEFYHSNNCLGRTLPVTAQLEERWMHGNAFWINTWKPSIKL